MASCMIAGVQGLVAVVRLHHPFRTNRTEQLNWIICQHVVLPEVGLYFYFSETSPWLNSSSTTCKNSEGFLFCWQCDMLLWLITTKRIFSAAWCISLKKLPQMLVEAILFLRLHKKTQQEVVASFRQLRLITIQTQTCPEKIKWEAVCMVILISLAFAKKTKLLEMKARDRVWQTFYSVRICDSLGRWNTHVPCTAGGQDGG